MLPNKTIKQGSTKTPRARQLSLIPHSLSFGGELLTGKRKTKRPLSAKRAVHTVFRSQEVLKIGTFKKHQQVVRGLLTKYSRTYHVRIYKFTICTNHIHCVFKCENVDDFKTFLRVFAGQVAQQLAKRAGHNLGAIQKKAFWLHRPFTRVLAWGRDFAQTLKYVYQNQLETMGFIPYKKRKMPSQKAIIARATRHCANKTALPLK